MCVHVYIYPETLVIYNYTEYLLSYENDNIKDCMSYRNLL